MFVRVFGTVLIAVYADVGYAIRDFVTHSTGNPPVSSAAVGAENHAFKHIRYQFFTSVLVFFLISMFFCCFCKL
jgi:hypothetical protein